MIWAEASVVTQADPNDVWRLWADVKSWNRWDEGIEWCEIDGAFQSGTTGRLKPKGGPKTRFRLISVEPNQGFIDRTSLPLASLWFTHELSQVEGGTRITHRVEFRGPMGWLFARLIGGDMKTGLPATVQCLARTAEQQTASARSA